MYNIYQTDFHFTFTIKYLQERFDLNFEYIGFELFWYKLMKFNQNLHANGNYESKTEVEFDSFRCQNTHVMNILQDSSLEKQEKVCNVQKSTRKTANGRQMVKYKPFFIPSRPSPDMPWRNISSTEKKIREIIDQPQIYTYYVTLTMQNIENHIIFCHRRSVWYFGCWSLNDIFSFSSLIVCYRNIR